MTVSIANAIPWDKLHNRYVNENSVYKDEAYRLLTDELGYDADIAVRIEAELLLRTSLVKYEAGQLDDDTLASQVSLLAKTVARMTNST